MEMALAAVDPSGSKAIHCSFDIDALDALDVPSTGTPGLFLVALYFQYNLTIRYK